MNKLFVKNVRYLLLVFVSLVYPAGAFSFTHPALLNNRAELDFIKSNISAGREPWKSAYAKMRTSNYAKSTYSPTPWDNVNCGSYSKPDSGCSDESNDAKAAYTNALLWYFTDSTKYAQKAVQILNAWSHTIKTHTNSNAPLQAAWTGALFPLAAEILRATYSAWTSAEIDTFSIMLKTVFVPLIINGMPTYNGNWELSMTNALVCIGVFTNDTATFNKGLFLWRKRVPAYFYLSTDGATPVRPYGTTKLTADSDIASYWYHSGKYVDGLCQETCRDFGHTQMGLAAAINTAEIAFHQGVDLYTEQDTRLMKAMEFHAGLLLGTPAPSWLCGGTVTGGGPEATWEIAYNHFHNRKGYALPLTDSLILHKIRPSGTGTHMAWESLTHGELSLGGSLVRNQPHAAPKSGELLQIVPWGSNQVKINSSVSGASELAVYLPNGKLMGKTFISVGKDGSALASVSFSPIGRGIYIAHLISGGQNIAAKFYLP